MLEHYRQTRDLMILEEMEKQVADALAKGEMVASRARKLNQASAVLPNLHDFKGQVRNPEPLNELEQKVKDFIHKTLLEGYLEAAEKAEFKRQRKKAVDLYREALYFLKHDDIDDRLQAENIVEIQGKLTELEKADSS